MLMDQCNSDCDCTSKWAPVCHAETGHIYYNPCLAGCTKKIKKGAVWIKLFFRDDVCVPDLEGSCSGFKSTDHLDPWILGPENNP